MGLTTLCMPQHVEGIKAHPLFTHKAIDFKLAESSVGADGVVTQETGFDNLAVRLCKVLSMVSALLKHNQHSSCCVAMDSSSDSIPVLMCCRSW